MKEMLITVLASSAFFSFLQFMLQRRDNKKNIKTELENQIDAGFAEIKRDNAETKKEIKEVSDRLEEHKAILARTHILRFADEQRRLVKCGEHHSEEYFKQQLEDIKTYDLYCAEHKDFKNELTVMSSQYIKDEYKRLFLSND